jgi:hypothetical protein
VSSTGDVDGGGLPDKLTPSVTAISNLEKIRANKNDIIEIPVFVENNIKLHSFHISLAYDVEKLDIINVETENCKGLYNNNNGVLKITASGMSGMLNENSKIATITARIKDFESSNELISINIDQYPQLIKENGEIEKSAMINIPSVEVLKDEFNALGSYPNPFTTNLRIEYFLPEDGYVSVAIYNAGGQIVNLVNREFKQAGQNIYQFDGSDIPSGMYFYRIVYTDTQSKEYLTTRSMIKSN